MTDVRISRHLTQAELAERWRVSDAHARPLARRSARGRPG